MRDDETASPDERDCAGDESEGLCEGGPTVRRRRERRYIRGSRVRREELLRTQTTREESRVLRQGCSNRLGERASAQRDRGGWI